jgi:hypothetical protein
LVRLFCKVDSGRAGGYHGGVNTATSFHYLIPMLQVAISPVILISGVGLLLLTMTNRLGRTIDRARQLAGEVDKRPGEKHLLVQVATVYRRAQVLRVTIVLAVLSVLLAGVLIIGLFLSALLQADDGTVIIVIFILCLSSLIGSLIAFLYDIHLSLAALKVELQQVKPDLK